MEARVGSGVAEVGAEPDGSFVLRVDGALQSRVDLDDPTRLLFEYVRRIGDVLDLIAPPRQPVSAVHVGGAGLTLPRYVAVTRPRSRQVVLEPDEDLTEFVRDTLPVPKRAGIRVRPQTGRAGMRDLYDASADVIVVDAFENEAVPRDLLTGEFVRDCARVLRPGGVFVLNLIDGHGLGTARRVAATLRAGLGDGVALAEQPVLAGKRFGNLVLLASRQALPVTALHETGTRGRPPYQAGSLRDLAGKARPLTDAELFESPAAPEGTFR